MQPTEYRAGAALMCIKSPHLLVVTLGELIHHRPIGARRLLLHGFQPQKDAESKVA